MKTTGMTTMEIKKINKSKVYHLIYDSRTISKQGIASALEMGMNLSLIHICPRRMRFLDTVSRIILTT